MVASGAWASMHRRRARLPLAIQLGSVLAAALAGCGSAPPTPSPPPALPAPAPTSPDPTADFESRQVQAAEAASRQGRWADAVWAWDVLLTLRPGHSGYTASRQQSQAQLESALTERLSRADAARRRGEIDAAASQYLGGAGAGANALWRSRCAARTRARTYTAAAPWQAFEAHAGAAAIANAPPGSGRQPRSRQTRPSSQKQRRRSQRGRTRRHARHPGRSGCGDCTAAGTPEPARPGRRRSEDAHRLARATPARLTHPGLASSAPGVGCAAKPLRP
jgi:hypothetical protein